MAFFYTKTYKRCIQLFGRHHKALSIVISTFLFPLILNANCAVSCVQSFNHSLGHEGFYKVSPADLLIDVDCDPNDFYVIVRDENGQPNGDTIDCQHVGQLVTAQVYEIASGNSCITTIQVFDLLPPSLVANDTSILCGLPYLPEIIGYAGVSDNCTELDSTDLVYQDETTNYDCLQIENTDTLNALVVRTWTVSDDAGNTSEVQQQIKIIKSTVDDVVFPPNINDLGLPSLNCLQDPNDLNLTGEPTIQGFPVSGGTFCDLIVSHDDTQVPNCGSNSFAIIRMWTVIDWCTGDFRTSNQIIKVVDTTAPVINCPQDVIFGSNVYECDGSVLLPTATAVDDCSNFQITASWQFGSGLGPFNNVPLGTYPVTYTAEDDCGNISACTINVTLEDTAPPVSICNSFLQYNLGASGEVVVFPEPFDGGTFDNCGLDYFQISLDGINFFDSLILNCEHIDTTPINVNIRAWDTAGNFNDCNGSILLEDKLFPIVTCPDDVTILCNEDALDLGLTGVAQTYDNCGVDTVYFSDSENLNTCGVGQIVRTWTIIDASGNSDFCSQVITTVDPDTLQVFFPDNFYSNQCGILLDTTITGAPYFSNDNCEAISYNFSDDTLSLVYPACYVIHRHWQVYEWCSHDAQTGAGYWTHTQVITVEDTDAPVLQIPADTTVYHMSSTCGNYFFNIPQATAVDCSDQISFVNNSNYANENGADASGFYPPGVHTIHFYAEDGCGNTSSESFELTVLDGMAPVAKCNGGLAFEMDATGTIGIDASEINASSFDNCSPADSLIVSIFPNQFTCDDLGVNPVTLTVQDEMGNTSSCVSDIVIQDNQQYCPGAYVDGVVNVWNGPGINNTTIKSSGAFVDTVYTNNAGGFSLGPITPGQNVVVAPTKTGDYRQGLSTLDVVLLSRYLVGLHQFNSPYQVLAGDVDRDGVISPFDLINIQKVIIFLQDDFPNTNSWRFAPDYHVFSNPAAPLNSQPEEYIAFNDIPDSTVHAGFIGMKMGDVSGNANPSLSPGSAGVDGDFMMIKETEQGLDFIFDGVEPVELYGVQLSLPMTKMEFEKIEKMSAGMELSYHYDEERGKLNILMNSVRGNWVESGDLLWRITGAMMSKYIDVENFENVSYVDASMKERKGGLLFEKQIKTEILTNINK